MLRQALLLQRSGRLSEAKELCGEVLARAPRHPLALYVVGALSVDLEAPIGDQ